jgi:mannose-6-phosphate isomerase-like protein (cupin superfamily)
MGYRAYLARMVSRPSSASLARNYDVVLMDVQTPEDGLEPVLLEQGKSAKICAASRVIRGVPDKGREEVLMKRLIMGLAATGLLVAPMSLNSLSAQQTDPQPTCRMCEGTYLPATEIQEYIKKALAERRTDQQARDVDIGKAHIGIGVVYRGKLDAPAPNSVAEHDLVSEVYYVMSGAGTLVLGPDIADMKRRPATSETVRLFNGPGNNGSTIRNGKTYNLKPGDVVIIPAGTGHWFTKIEDHVSYVMVRIDPDKVTPLMDEVKSKEWLATPRNPTAPRGE